MNTIDHRTIYEAMDHVESAEIMRLLDTVHTVTITLNGQHGGCDLIMSGSDRHGDETTVKVPFGTVLANSMPRTTTHP